MQAILARMKASSEPQVAGAEPQAKGQPEEAAKKNAFLNNFGKDVNNNNRAEFSGDAESVEQLSDSGGASKVDDPADEIDIVMASNNKFQPKLRGRSITSSSPRETLKNSRTRGSRVSLNSVATNEKEDVSVIDIGTESEEEGTPRQARILTPMQAWSAFEDTVKNIDNSNPYAFMKKPKPTFVSSGTFQKVMVDMYGNSEYGNTKGYTLLKKKLNNMARASTMASRMFTVAAKKGKEDRENEEIEESECEHEDDEEDNKSPEPQGVNKVFAKRGWKMLKRQVNETTMEQKTQSGKLNWTMLQHTIKQMSNVERTRQDLYERYGIVPTVKEDGTTVCENRMLSERARAQLSEKNREGGSSMRPQRPHSYQPPPTHLRTGSQNSFHKKGNGGKTRTNRNGLPNIGNTRQRPVTAMR